MPEGNSLRGGVKLLVVKSTDREGGRKGCGRGAGSGWRLSAPPAAWLVLGLCFACKQVVKSSLTQAPTCGGRRTHWNTGLARGVPLKHGLFLLQVPPQKPSSVVSLQQVPPGWPRRGGQAHGGLASSLGNAGPEAHSAAKESRVLAP